MVDDFIGRTFGKDGQVEVVGWDGERSVSGVKVYTVKCSVCAKDPELFDEGMFKRLKGNLVEGKLPCGCAPSPQWTEAQNVVRVKRQCTRMCCEFLGWAVEYEGSTTKLKLKCLKDGHEWASCILLHFLRGVGCPQCCNQVHLSQEQQEAKIETTMAGTKLTFMGWAGEYKNNYSKFTVNCADHDPYEVSVSNFINRKSGCPSCAKSGFDPSKPAHVYVLSVDGVAGSFTGYGVSNDLKKRLTTHKRKLKEKGFSVEKYEAFSVSGAQAIVIENMLKVEFPLCTQDVEGFRTEATNACYYDAVVSAVSSH